MISLDTKGKQISLGDGCKLWQLVKIVENNENTSAIYKYFRDLFVPKILTEGVQVISPIHAYHKSQLLHI